MTREDVCLLMVQTRHLIEMSATREAQLASKRWPAPLRRLIGLSTARFAVIALLNAAISQYNHRITCGE